MSATRRDVMRAGLVTAAVFFGLPAFADEAGMQAAIDAFTGGAETADDGLTLIAPEIAENGNAVPIEVDAPGAEAILIVASGNPNPDVATFAFGPMSGSQRATTRIRLAGTQDVVAVARMPDGTFKSARQNVRVTIGGCGG
jgi:sulfur-oxidizing protein SoxY